MSQFFHDVAAGIFPLVPVWVWLVLQGRRINKLEMENLKFHMLLARLCESQAGVNAIFMRKIKQNDL